ncbi:hypothetical protein AB1N83_009728 [Pleurotus pulmonarius]
MVRHESSSRARGITGTMKVCEAIGYRSYSGPMPSMWTRICDERASDGEKAMLTGDPKWGKNLVHDLTAQTEHARVGTSRGRFTGWDEEGCIAEWAIERRDKMGAGKDCGVAATPRVVESAKPRQTTRRVGTRWAIHMIRGACRKAGKVGTPLGSFLCLGHDPHESMTTMEWVGRRTVCGQRGMDYTGTRQRVSSLYSASSQA